MKAFKFSATKLGVKACKGATVALALGALQLSAFAQSLPAPPVSPAPVHTYGYDANGNPTTATVAGDCWK